MFFKSYHRNKIGENLLYRFASHDEALLGVSDLVLMELPIAVSLGVSHLNSLTVRLVY